MTKTAIAPEMEWIMDRTRNARYYISEHVIRFLMGNKITVRKIEDAVYNGKIIEVHKYHQRGESSLISGYSEEEPVHVLCADGGNNWLVILFAYVPSLPIWENSVKRVKTGGADMEDAFEKCFFCNGELKQITMGNFDYRLEGQLYVIKKLPARLCLQCGEKYITAGTAKKINAKIEAGQFAGTDEVYFMEYE